MPAQVYLIDPGFSFSQSLGRWRGVPAHHTHVITHVCGDLLGVVRGDNCAIRKLSTRGVTAVYRQIKVHRNARRQPGLAVVGTDSYRHTMQAIISQTIGQQQPSICQSCQVTRVLPR